MSSTTLGIAIGVVFIFPTIYLLRRLDIEAQAWPGFLLTLPVYYMLFGLLVLDFTTIAMEAAYGVPFVIIGLLAWKKRSPMALTVTALGWMGHGFYDFYHDHLFINAGVFAWYPAFCAFVDGVVGLYLLTQVRQLTTDSNTAASAAH